MVTALALPSVPALPSIITQPSVVTRTNSGLTEGSEQNIQGAKSPSTPSTVEPTAIRNQEGSITVRAQSQTQWVVSPPKAILQLQIHPCTTASLAIAKPSLVEVPEY